MKNGKNTFENWQNNNQNAREELISSYLKYLFGNKVKARDVTALADLVATHLTATENRNRPCSRSTLLRNERYRVKLDDYQKGVFNKGTNNLDVNKVSDSTAKALIMVSQAQVTNMKRELNRVNIYTKTLEERIEMLVKVGHCLPPSGAAIEMKDSENRLKEFEYKFLRTSQVLRSVLAYFNEIIEVNMEFSSILDRSKRRNNVIVNGEVAKPFFEWLSSVAY